MTNSKETKRALLSSSVSMLVCVSMLVGSTFAWFTDNVTNTNKIVAGRLDVELYMHDGTDYINISKDQSPIFGEGSIAQNNNAETLWEPGKTQVAYLMVKNEGNLDLKYRVDVNVENVAKDLYKVMRYAIIPDAQNGEVATWDSSVEKQVNEGINPTDFSDISLGAGEEHYFALALHMEEEAGNEYQDGSVSFDITVNATQLSSEEDSFGAYYDEDAAYDTETPVARTKVISGTTTFKNPEGVEILSDGLWVDTTGSRMGSDLGKIMLDTAYQFEPTLSAEEVKSSEYKTWHADFVVSVDKDIPDNSIALAGYYDAWCSFNNDKWVALTNEGLPVDANEEIRLIDAMGNGSITVSLKDLSDYGNDGIGFLCGAKELNNLLPANTTLTVELRLYEATGGSRDSETGKFMTVGKYRYTFK